MIYLVKKVIFVSGYNYDYFVKCFAERTLTNYETINKAKKESTDEVYEVTQLINSLFGLLIIPFEKFKCIDYDFASKEAYFQTWAQPEYSNILSFINSLKNDNRLVNTYCENYKSAYNFIRHLRNALAHSGDKGLHFLPCNDSSLCITSIIFYDSNKDINSHFCTEIKTDELKLLIENISLMYQKIEKIENINHQKDFNKIENEYKQILKGKSQKLLD